MGTGDFMGSTSGFDTFLFILFVKTGQICCDSVTHVMANTRMRLLVRPFGILHLFGAVQKS